MCEPKLENRTIRDVHTISTKNQAVAGLNQLH